MNRETQGNSVARGARDARTRCKKAFPQVQSYLLPAVLTHPHATLTPPTTISGNPTSRLIRVNREAQCEPRGKTTLQFAGSGLDKDKWTP